MGDYKIRIGKYGEKIAAEFLARQGLKLLGKNYYTRYGEIDLIASSGDEILFVEVKTRTSNEFGYPEDAVDWIKVMHLNKAINIYLADKKIEKFWRLDVISVEVDVKNKKAKIKWFKDLS